MEVSRQHLTVLLNALYDTGTTQVSVAHPSPEIGELVSITLGDAASSTLRFESSLDEYAAARSAVNSTHGSPVSDELPSVQSYGNAFLAGGILTPSNQDKIDSFLDRHGHPDLTAGHRPVVAGFDTNLLPWRIADVLELFPGQDATVNGFALATGVRDELDWDKKRSDTRAIEKAFGEEFDALWNQPAGARREGRLGETYYRQLRDHRYAEEVNTGRGDEAIIQGYDEYQGDSGKDVLLFSNDRDFVERSRSHRVLAQRVEFPHSLPTSVDISWPAIQDTLYVLTVLFGVLKLPKVTLYGVWKGKGGQAWQNEELLLDCRSPKVEPMIRRDITILEALK